MSPRIFIPQVPQHWDAAQGCMVAKFDTLNKAEDYGKLIILLDRNDDVWKPDTVIAKLHDMMSDFSDDDYVLPMGAYHFMMWTYAIALGKVSDTVKSLHWHQREKAYRVISTPRFI